MRAGGAGRAGARRGLLLRLPLLPPSTPDVQRLPKKRERGGGGEEEEALRAVGGGGGGGGSERRRETRERES